MTERLRTQEIGDIKVTERLPEVFKEEAVRMRAADSVEQFKAEHEGTLPEKFRIAEFIFDRDDQICTADSRNKYLAWRANDLELAADILSKITPEERSVVLRANMLEVADDTPALQITEQRDIDEFITYVTALRNQEDMLPSSKIWDEFFAQIKHMNADQAGKDTLDDTIVQLLTNITEQKGLFLVRPTFIYDKSLREEIRGYTPGYEQTAPDFILTAPDVPEAFACFRVLPIGEFAREKKQNLGYVFVYNPDTRKFDVRSGFPDIRKYHGAASDPRSRKALGRTIDFDNKNKTTFHYEMEGAIYSLTDVTDLDTLSLNEVDLTHLQHVLEWQLPRIFTFEDEIRQQQWLSQGESTTHQFVIFPPQQTGDRRINTQYFDFHPYADVGQLEEKARHWHNKPFNALSTEEKVITFF